MKRNFTYAVLFFVTLALSSSYIIKDSNGKAGYTGSPGEQTCSGGGGCHSGGSSPSKSVTITSTPSFSLNKYYPDTVYTVSVTVIASGFSHFGFGAEIIDVSGVNTGTMQLPGSGVKMLNAFNSRRNATHTAPKVSTGQATFTFKWIAPPLGSGDAIFYACGNAVNGNGNTTGDLPIPYSYTITEGVAPTPTINTVEEINNNVISKVMIFPNPSNGLSTISYNLKETKTMKVALIDIGGKKVKDLASGIQYAGEHSEALNLQDVPKGVYFVKILANEQKISQKLITVN